MTTFNDYLKYRLRSSLLRTVAFAVIALILTYYSVTPTLSIWNVADDYGANFYYKVPGGIYAGYLDLSAVSTLLAVAAAVIAALEMSGFKNKRNLDAIYSLPLSRLQLALAHYASGAVQVFAVHTASVFCALVAALPYVAQLKLWILPVYYVFSLVFGLGLYSFISFFFMEGNTVFDGAVFAGAWFIVLLAVLGTLNDSNVFAPYLSAIQIRDYKIVFADYPTWGMADAPLKNLATVFTDMIGVGKNFKEDAERIMDTFYMFYVWAAIYAACAYGYFRSFVRAEAEKTGEISNSPFGYKFLIPFFSYAIVLSSGEWLGIYSVFIFVLMIIAYIVYRRGIKLKKSDVASIIIAVLLMVILGISRTLAQLLPLAAAFVSVFICLVRLINAADEKESKGEIAKRAVLLALSVLLAALLVIAGWGTIFDFIGSLLY